MTHSTQATTALDLTPRPGPAPAARRVLRQARTEALLLVRNGEQLLLALVIPAVALVVGTRLFDRWGTDLLSPAQFAASVLALAIWSTSFTSVAIATGFERRYGVLERLASTPLGRGGLLLGKALAVAVVVTGQLVVLGLLAVLLGWRPAGEVLPWLIAAAAVLLAVVCFAAWALALAGRVRAEATLALANLIYLLMAAGGGILVGPDAYPAPWSTVVAVLPTAALAEALRNAATGVVAPVDLLILLIWAVLGVATARRSLRWTS